MTSARKKAAETMERVDIVIEVLDARLPEASSNPMIKELRLHRQRNCLKVLNKSDLADPLATKAWLDYFNAQKGVKAIAISGKKLSEVSKLPSHCEKLAPHRNDNLKPLRMMIMGIPNVGKSTIMNALLKRKVAKVGDEPAITKVQQILDINSRMTIIDTPGMMWPKIAFDADGYMLAASHAIGTNAVVEDEVAYFLADLLLSRYPAAISQRYGFATETMDGVAAVEAIAKKRNCIKPRSKEWDIEKAALILLTDYRDGLLGRISLETPLTRAAMVAAAPIKVVTKSAAQTTLIEDEVNMSDEH